MLLQCLDISKHTLSGSIDLIRTADQPNLMMLLLHQHGNCLLSSHLIIYQHTVTGKSLDHTVNKHDGLPSSLKLFQMGTCHIHRHIDDSVHALPGKKVHSFPLQVLIGPAVTDNGCISMTAQNILHAADDLGAEYVIQLRDHHPHCLRGISLQSAGNLIHFIV